MNFVFLVDKLDSFNIKKDTSYILMVAALKRNHQIYAVYRKDISLIDSKLHFHVKRIKVTHNQDTWYEVLEEKTLIPSEVSAVIVRTDPPFDSHYITDMWLLDLLPKNILVVNEPMGITAVNEKLWINRFANLVPKTLITSKVSEYRSFLEKHKKVIVKPLNGFGGSQIFIAQDDHPNANVIFESVSQNETDYVIVQEFLAGAANGDKRIHLLGGEILGALYRIHSSTDFRNNFAKGASCKQANISKKEKEIIETLKPWLIEMGLHYVGLDIIDEKLIEVNVTSPTTIQELNFLDDKNYDEEIIKYIEDRVK